MDFNELDRQRLIESLERCNYGTREELYFVESIADEWEIYIEDKRRADGLEPLTYEQENAGRNLFLFRLGLQLGKLAANEEGEEDENADD